MFGMETLPSFLIFYCLDLCKVIGCMYVYIMWIFLHLQEGLKMQNLPDESNNLGIDK